MDPSSSETRDPRVAVVMIVLNGAHRIGRSLSRLSALPERPQIVVVDNGSTDGTPDVVRREFPHVYVVRAPGNLGAAGRNLGVAAARAPYIAFAEDDSWYEPGALTRAADVLDAHPDVALLNAHVLVGSDRRPDPLHGEMVGTPVSDVPGLPGHPILSFLEGASVVRRSAYEAVGGYDPRMSLGGPEEHLAADLLSAGWKLRYLPDVVARHCPDHGEPPSLIRRLGLRNTLWFAWGRRPLRPALRWTAHVIGDSPANADTAAGVLMALAGLPHVLRERRRLPPEVEHDMALLDVPKRTSTVRRYGRDRGLRAGTG